MGDSDEVISVWRDVSIEISENYLAPGKLKMIRSGVSIVFYWFPYTTTNTDLFDIDPGHTSFAIELRQVDSISFDISNVDYGILEILFKDFTVFPRLFFNNHGNLAISHLIQFLLNQKIATMSSLNESMISISLNVLPLNHLPENITNSVRFKTLVDHWRTLDLLGVHEPIESSTPVTEEEINNYIENNENSDHSDTNIESLSYTCFNRGINNEDRCKIWPLFLKPNTKYHMEDPKNLTRYQNKMIAETLNTIKNDTDNLTKSNQHSPLFLQFLRDILCSISIFYPNATYQKGLCDILTIFIEIFVKSFQEENENNKTVIMNDGRSLDYNEARYYIFSLFIHFIIKNGNQYSLTQTNKFYQFFIDRINAIIESVDPPLSSRLALHQIKDLSFLSESIYLLYSKDFERDKLLRLWDSIVTFSDDKTPFFILFFHSALIILLFNPMFMTNKNNSIEDIFNLVEDMKKKVDLELVVRMAKKLTDIVKNKKNLEWIFQPLDEEKDYIDYQPTYLTILNE